MKIKKCETRTQFICEIEGHSYVRTLINWNGDRPQTISWHLNEDHKIGEIYLTEEKLEELFNKRVVVYINCQDIYDELGVYRYTIDIKQFVDCAKVKDVIENLFLTSHTNLNQQINKNVSCENKTKERILDKPANYSLSEIFKELKFGRPAENQRFLDSCIEMLEKEHDRDAEYSCKENENIEPTYILHRRNLEEHLKKLTIDEIELYCCPFSENYTNNSFVIFIDDDGTPKILKNRFKYKK